MTLRQTCCRSSYPWAELVIAGQVAESKPEGLSSMAKRRKKGVSK